MTRYKQGIEKFREIKGEGAEKSLERLKSLSPDLAQYIMEFAFNDIYRRPGLDLRSREIATLAALTALGTSPQQLKVHTICALNVGVTKKEITEIILQMALYAGFPAAINGMQAVNEAFDEFDKQNPGSIKSANNGIDIHRKKAISA